MKSAFSGKIRGDLRREAGKLAVLSLAVGIGVFVLAGIAGTASTLAREIAASYESTNPATATFEFGGTVEEAWAESLAGKDGVLDARAGGSFTVRFLDGRGQWQPMLIFVLPDFERNRIAVLFPEAGTSWPPRVGDIALERTAYPTFALKPEEPVRIRFPDGSERSALPGSVVHDPGVAPAYQERTAYAYIDRRTARSWGLEGFDQVKLRLDQSLSWDEAKKKALELAASFERGGARITDVLVPPVHRHPHQGILMTLLAILGAFGVLTILLCSLLVATTVSAMLAKERRWIGVMKTLGAAPGRILALALAPVLALGLGAVAWAVPAGILASKGLGSMMAGLLNFSLRDPSAQWWAWALPIAAGLLVPLAVALAPARAALRDTILEAIADAGTDAERFSESRGPVARLLWKANPTLGMAWLNSMRRKKRFALSLLLLGVGGGLFITGSNLGSSWKGLLAESFAAKRMDYQARIVGNFDEAKARSLSAGLGGLRAAETWGSMPAATAGAAGIPLESTYPDEAHGSLRIFGLPGATSMLAFPMLSGRWSTGAEEAVMNQGAAMRFPGIKVGDEFELIIGGETARLRLAGIARELGQAAVYADARKLESFAGTGDYRSELLVSLELSADRDAARKDLEARLAEARLPVEVLIDGRELEMAGTEHFGILIGIIIALGGITGFVGWLGIASILGLAVAERRREFGIIRSIGGTPGKLLAAVTAEAAAMTVLGSIAAVALSIPLSIGLGAYVGNLAAKMALPLYLDLPMALAWLAVSLPAGVLASLGAGLRAARVTVRETLAYA
jgi:putative ABC transport system permease protein